jgi:NADH-quinone oxidoreductase subunit G
MGVLPDLLPGYRAAPGRGMDLDQMLAADLDALWVVGANPLKDRPAPNPGFLVVHELFLTETAQAADVVFPAASAYEKSGTVTNTCGQVQRLTRALVREGAKPDLEIMSLLAGKMGLDLGPATPEAVFAEIAANVPGYNVSLPVLDAGGSIQAAPVAGPAGIRVRPELIRSAGDTLFTSGSLGRYSNTLKSVAEGPGSLYRG